MKIRTSFVTNSSSSSFVIAIHNDATEEDIKNALMADEELFKNGVKDMNNCWDEEYTLEQALENLVAKFMRYKNYNSMKLDNWLINSKTFYSDGDYEESFINSWLTKVDSEKFKLESTD